MNLQRIRIVLVNTTHPGNIGAVARAMKNMSLSQLVLVGPSSFPDPEASARAAGAEDILAAARVTETLDEAISGCTFVTGASARLRNLPWPVVSPRDMAESISDQPDEADVAILFGREHSGLTNEELQRCNLHVHIPSNPEYSSLNVAMAVQIICYELYLRKLVENPMDGTNISRTDGPGQAEWGDPPASVDDVEKMLIHLEKTLTDVGFHNPQQPGQLMPRLRRLFQRVMLDKMEVNILRGMLKSIQKSAGTWVPSEQNSPRKQ